MSYSTFLIRTLSKHTKLNQNQYFFSKCNICCYPLYILWKFLCNNHFDHFTKVAKLFGFALTLNQSMALTVTSKIAPRENGPLAGSTGFRTFRREEFVRFPGKVFPVKNCGFTWPFSGKNWSRNLVKCHRRTNSLTKQKKLQTM